MLAFGSFRLVLVVVITGVIGTIGGDVSPVMGDTQNADQRAANRTERPAVDRGSPTTLGTVVPAETQPQIATFAQSSGALMTDHHRAQPDLQPVEVPYLEHPPAFEVPVGAAGLIQQQPPEIVRVDAVAATPVPGGDVEPFAPPLAIDFAGTLDNGTSIPPDTHGAVGPNHVVNMLNTGFQVFNRGGAVVMPQISLGSFWSSLGSAASGPFDPKILFDQYIDRWVVVSDSRAQSANSNVLVGISDTDDPTGTWNLFAIKADPASTHWADYPGLGIDGANVYVTQNMFPVGGGSVYAKFWVISKASMIAGGPLNMRTDVPTALPGFSYQPCHSFDASPGGLNYLVSQGWQIGGTARRLILVNRYVGVGAAAVLTELGFIEVGGYTFSHLDAPQKDCGTNISTNDPRLLNAVMRNGKVWTTHSVGVGASIDPAPATRAEIAWHQLDPTVANIPGPYSFAIQDGRVGHATLAYYFPSIAVNANECVALGFSGSDASSYASAYYTARSPLDPPGTMQPVNTLHAGTAGYWKQFSGTRNRWGDYSATVVDPVDDLTFWTTQEYATTPFSGGPICSQDGGRWGLWWGAFECLIGKTDKFSQPPDDTGEDAASNIDWTDMSPNVVLADDFVSDGRPITGVRWWGSNLALPLPDGWLISFHEPLTTGGSPETPLGLYFCDTNVVIQTPTAYASCDAEPVIEYEVQIEDCCLIHSNSDSRSGSFPAQADGFFEQICLAYDLDVQAFVGYTYVVSGGCVQTPTLNSATDPFWGWHTTGVESGLRPALQSSVSMSGSNWLYGPWTPLVPSCGAPNMAFELLTDQPQSAPDCNLNGTPDVCESGPDCQPNNVLDECDIARGTSQDCDGNTIPDECDILTDPDCNNNSVLDECDPDCNNSGIPDDCEIASDPDCNANGFLDECDAESVGSLTSAPSAVLGFVDISGTGTPLNLGDDESANVTMPFTTAALGGPTVSVANNGGVGLIPDTGLGPVDNWPLPHVNAFGGNPGLLAYWDDLDSQTGNVYYQTIGITPNRTFIVQWDDRPHFAGDAILDGDEVTFEIQIFESPVGGIVAQYLYADTNFLNANFNDGRSATVGYQRNATSAIQWSFNTTGAVTPRVVLSLLKNDLNGNGIPDACDAPGEIVWDPATNPTPWPNNNPDATTRSLRLKVTSAGTGTPPYDAIEVTMVDLQNPIPANLPQNPPPNFSGYESGTCAPKTCVGGDRNGLTCTVPADCPSPGVCTAAVESNSCARWVGKPGTFLESQDSPGSMNYRAARLQCTPFYTDWVTETAGGPIVVVGAEIAPSSEYSVQAYGASCNGVEASCANVSTPVTMYTRRFGDVEVPFVPPNATGQPDVTDVAQLVNRFKNVAGAPVKAVSQLQPNLPELNADINALDIVAVVDAVKQRAYSFSGPCPCPSTVTCGSTACSSPTICASTYGPGAVCVKTCTGPGLLAGDPCINDSHCVGSGTCAAGFCRDRCGRCTP